MVDAVLYRDHTDSKLRTLGDDAWRWIRADGGGSASFESVCTNLGLDHTMVRGKIATMPVATARALRGMDFADD
jgi:hypothetical protein